jgi:hypothetical protein
MAVDEFGVVLSPAEVTTPRLHPISGIYATLRYLLRARDHDAGRLIVEVAHGLRLRSVTVISLSG